MISEDFVDKYSAQRLGESGVTEGIVDTISKTDDFLAATAVDVGTSLWNSLITIPKVLGINTDEYKADTYDLLRSVNEDWANFYSANKESVETASFLAGALIPGGVALKGMKLLQAGKIGFYPSILSEGRQAARIAELQTLLENGAGATSQFRNLRWKILAANAGQETAQAAGMELAVIGGLSQHPWLEDYFKDPVTNFGLSVAIGGVIGSGLGQIFIRKQLADKLGATATSSLNKSLDKIIDIPVGSADVDKIQRYTMNAKNLRSIVEDPEQTQLTKEIASVFATRYEGMVGELEQKSVLGPMLKSTEDVEARKGARDILLSDAAFGANRVEFANFKETEFIGQSRARSGEFFIQQAKEQAQKYEELFKAGQVVRSSLVASEALKLIKPEWSKLMEEDFRIFYSPYHKAWIPADEIHNYVRAVDTGRTSYEIRNIYRPNADAFAEITVRGVPTSKSDKYWIDTLGSVAQAQLQKLVTIAQSDIGTQNAWLSRLQGIQKEGRKLPEIKIVSDSAAENAPISQIIKAGKTVTLEDLENNIATQKESMIRGLLTQGASVQEIGIRLNIPQVTVERHLLEGKSLQELGNWRTYTNAGAIDTEYASQKTRALEFVTNGKRIASLSFRNADQSAILDAKFIRAQNKEIMTNIVAGSNSDIAKTFFTRLNADDEIWDLFSSQLGNIVNEKSGSFFFSSADFASRRMGDISTIASVKGQTWVGIVNNTSERLLTPLSARVRTQTVSQTGLNEFNEVLNTLQSISGHRDIDQVTGQLFRLVEMEPGAFVREPIRNAEGMVLNLSENMRAVLLEARKVGREMYEFKNTLNKIQGFKELNDIGLWLPVFNPVNKFVSYVIDTEASEVGGRVKMLVAKTPEQLADMERDWSSKFGNNKRYNLVTKSQQEDYNFWQMRLDPVELDMADISKFHSGASASAARVVDDSYASTLVENLHNRVIYYGRKMQELYLEDIMSQLDLMSAMNQKYTAAQPTVLKAVGLSQKEDAARAVKNMLLGSNNLDQYTTWKTVNNGFSSMVEWSSKKISDIYSGTFKESTDVAGKTFIKEGDYIKYSKELEGLGLKNPFKDFNQFLDASFDIKNPIRLVRDDTQDEVGRFYKVMQGDNEVAHMQIEQMGRNNDHIYIHSISSMSRESNTLGLSAMRDIGSALKKEFPSAKTVGGERVSGVREGMASTEAGGPVIATSIPDIKMSTLEKRDFADRIDSTFADSIARKHNISHPSAEKIIAAGNGILATLALRVLETGQAFVTAVSWPIMTMPEIYRNLPKTFLGNAATAEGIPTMLPARAMMDGIRFRHSDAAKPLIDKWIEEGFGKSIVSEATRLNQLLVTGGKGAIGKINDIIESDLIKTLSKPSDFMEAETRLWVLSTGFQLARRMYPGINDAGADMFAREFMLRSVGNYYSAQRPAMFQGTFGVAIGLFQTYMLSWAQSAFRSIENREFKALSAQMLAQAGMFGMSSTPLYDLFSKTIGTHFSDKHYDLQTGTYRALPHAEAEFITYGLPASLGVGVYTRGDMQPRLPFTQDSPLDTIAAINATRQILGATGHMISKVYEANGIGNKFRGLLEGMSMQSISRPLARIVEAVPVPDGQGGFEAVGSISRQGNTISTSDQIWSGSGVSSRLLASRGTEEQIRREADYLNSFYGSVDFKNRKKATESLKTAIRAGDLNDETMTNVAREYLRTGSSTGWRAALNEALATSEGGIDYKLGKRLRPDSPLQLMVRDNF